MSHQTIIFFDMHSYCRELLRLAQERLDSDLLRRKQIHGGSIPPPPQSCFF